MAVKIVKAKLTLNRLAAKILESPDYLKVLPMVQAITDAGFTVSLGPKKLSLVRVSVVTQEESVLHSSDISGTAITLALKNDLSPPGLEVLQKHLLSVIQSAGVALKEWLSKEKELEVASKVASKLFTDSKVAAIKEYRTLTNTSLKEAKDYVEILEHKLQGYKEGESIESYLPEASIAPPSQVAPTPTPEVQQIATPSVAPVSKKPVALAKATLIKQPVHGTSESSVYHTIAIGDDANVAIRIKSNNSIAIRVHPITQVGSKACSSAGFQKKTQGHYSLHLEPGTELLASKALGALLFAMGLPWSALSTDIHSYKGLGS